MFEVANRVGCGRSGKLSGDGWQLATPAIFYLDTGRFPAPGHAEALLRRVEGVSQLSVGSGTLSFPGYEGTPYLRREGQEPRPPKVMGNVCLIAPETPIPDISEIKNRIDLYILENSIELYQNSKIFIDTVTRVREAIGFQSALYLPAVALPNNLALLAYLGADIVDSSRAAILASQGYFLTSDGAWPRSEAEKCLCSACAGGLNLYGHNMLALESEMHRLRARLANGALREYVEYRAKTSPALVEMLRHLDREHYQFQESRYPVVGQKFKATTRLALGRPDIARFRQRIVERYRKPAIPQVLVLLPCSARKPYSRSKSHGFFREAIASCGAELAVHELIVTSPLGLVPRELELFYPAQHYDIPVTGHWFRDEKDMINSLLKQYLENNNYIKIFNHLSDDGLIDGLDAEVTTEGSPTSDESLRNLRKALSEFQGAAEGNWGGRAVQEMNSMAMFQFGPRAEGIFDGCIVKGRYPQLKIFKGGEQLASISEANGLIVPTIDGARLLAGRGLYAVNIADFQVTGSIFAVGVESADPQIRPGDEVIILRNGELAASGTARMSGPEMAESARGEAVRVRHKAKQ